MLRNVIMYASTILLVLTGFILSASFVVATNQTIPVYEFVDCNHSLVSITVEPLHTMYTKEYVLHNCDLVNETEQRWECLCEDNLTVSLESLQGEPKTYVYTVVVVEENDESFLQTSNEVVRTQTPEEEITIDDLPASKTSGVTPFAHQLTGAVVGTQNSTQGFSVQRWGLMLFLVLSISLLINIRFVDVPWQSKQIRARRLHKHAKQAFTDGEHKRAQRYYKKAAELRSAKKETHKNN